MSPVFVKGLYKALRLCKLIIIFVFCDSTQKLTNTESFGTEHDNFFFRIISVSLWFACVSVYAHIRVGTWGGQQKVSDLLVLKLQVVCEPP